MKLKTLLISLPVALLLTPAAAHADTSCKNETAREQNNSTTLPDCRAYEMVSPLDKNGGDISTINTIGNGGVIQATPDGTKITYVSLTAFGIGEDGKLVQPKGAPTGSQYLSTQATGGWNTQNITIPFQTPNVLSNHGTPYKAFNTNLTEGLLLNTPSEEIEEPPIGGAPEHYRDYYTHNLTNNTNQALLTTTPPIPPQQFDKNNGHLNLEGYATTPDLKHTILTSGDALTPGATTESGRLNLYESINGQLEAVNIPPNPTTPGETTPEAKLGSGHIYQDRTISNDGSRVFWSTKDGSGDLFVREGIGTPQAKTVEVDASQGGTGTGQGTFLTASTDGSKGFFSSHERLTPDATTPEDGFTRGPSDLYEYDAITGHLTDLTVDHSDANGADVQGVLGASDDGSYLYFVATGVLSSANSRGEAPASGSDNLYLWHEGSPTVFIASLSLGDAEHDWPISFAERTTRVSPDGRYLVFVSEAPLTSFDNAGHQEVYEYEAGSTGPVCVSCNPSGAAAVGSSSIPPPTEYDFGSAVYESRVLSSEGNRVFFDSNDALVPGDTNGKQDVYQWEHLGTGSCSSATSSASLTFVPASNGCVSLISGGTSSEESTFADASENGDNVFFTTRQQLTPGDTDQEADLYDAREGGGQTYPASLACTGTGCQGNPAPAPIFATPATVTFNGTGNFPTAGAPAAKPAVKKKPQSNAQKLAAALKVCAKDRSKAKRAGCKTAARRRYAPAKRKK